MAIRQSVQFSVKLKKLVFCGYAQWYHGLSVDVQVMGIVKIVFLERLFRQNPNDSILRYIQFVQSAVESYENIIVIDLVVLNLFSNLKSIFLTALSQALDRNSYMGIRRIDKEGCLMVHGAGIFL